MQQRLGNFHAAAEAAGKRLDEVAAASCGLARAKVYFEEWDSPLITGMKSEGKGVEYEEMLSRRLKHPSSAHSSTMGDGGLPFSSA